MLSRFWASATDENNYVLERRLSKNRFQPDLYASTITGTRGEVSYQEFPDLGLSDMPQLHQINSAPMNNGTDNAAVVADRNTIHS